MKKTLLALTLLLSSCPAVYAASACPHLYPHGTPIEVFGTVELCNPHYVAVYRPSERANVFSAEFFDAAHPNIKRVNAFRADKRIAVGYRAATSDYLHSGYDMGHMAAADDAPTAAAQRETYLLTNITPQAPVMNEVYWKYLEQGLLDTVAGPVYVITGAIYDFASGKKIGKNGIPVPVSYYKCAWYGPGFSTSACFVADNNDQAMVTLVNIDHVNRITGFNLY